MITETPRTGWSVASHAGESVALDLALDARLIAKGVVREAIRAIQDARKESDFDVSDRIQVRWNANEDVAQAILEATSHISDEVLATSFERDKSLSLSEEELGLTLRLTRV